MADRDIYQCPVSGRHLDPFKVHRDLTLASGGKIGEFVRGRGDADPVVAAKADEAFTAAVRKALDLPGIDPKTGAGFTDREALAAYNAYQDYLAGKGPRGQSSPGPSPCAGCPQG